MPNYRRAYRPGGTFFFTLVTADRRPFLVTPAARACLHDAIADTRALNPFELDAIVLLPDHLHAIWTLPDGDADFSKRWRLIKARFTRRFRESDAAGFAIPPYISTIITRRTGDLACTNTSSAIATTFIAILITSTTTR